ncbi:MAG: Fe-S protein assembly co-chaperone HscB [Candidatus Paceibacteria bacterium]|jgi:Fe-S protein assembly co-chaperone HscB
MTLCPHCAEDLVTPLVCLACGELLQVSQAPSPFAALGLEPAWAVDPKDLKRRILKFSRAVHPDFFATAAESVQQRAEDASAALNAANNTLKDEFRRADWLVSFLGGPSEADERQMPQAFLMQVMDWNETLEEARESEQDSNEWRAMEALAAELKSERQENLTAIEGLLTPLPAAKASALGDARKRLNAIRYIDRTRTEIKNLQLQATLKK